MKSPYRLEVLEDKIMRVSHRYYATALNTMLGSPFLYQHSH